MVESITELFEHSLNDSGTAMAYEVQKEVKGQCIAQIGVFNIQDD